MTMNFTRLITSAARHPRVGQTLRAALASPIVKDLAATASAAVVEALKQSILNANVRSKAVRDEDPGMSTIGEVENAVLRVEKVSIRFLHKKTLRDVRDDRRALQPYTYVNKLKDSSTVADLIKGRLSPYVEKDLRVVVLDSHSNIAHANTILGNLRSDLGFSQNGDA